MIGSDIMTQLMTAIGILTAISILALLGLVYVYYRNLKQIKSKFTIGLLIFALLFLMQNVISVYYYATMMDYYVDQVQPFVFVFSLLQTIAFVVLLKISWE